MKNRKLQFLRAVRLLAPRDHLVLEFAERVPNSDLASLPGAAALEFVAAWHEFQKSPACPRRGLSHWRLSERPRHRQQQRRRSSTQRFTF